MMWGGKHLDIAFTLCGLSWLASIPQYIFAAVPTMLSFSLAMYFFSQQDLTKQNLSNDVKSLDVNT